jgi:hypothetical protein
MKDIEILEQQISSQIEGCTRIKVFFSDNETALIKLYSQDEEFFLEPTWLKTKKISKKSYNEIMDSCKDVHDNTCKNELHIHLTYNEFFAKHYN